jgi:hypothetical protein
MKDILTSYLVQGLTILLQIAALFLFYGLVMLKKKAEAYFAAHLDAKQLELLHTIGREAYAFAETTYRELNGAEKLSAAMDFFEKRAREKGIPFDAESARLAIEKAWLEVEGVQKKTKTPA